MKKTALTCLTVILLAGAGLIAAEMPQMPPPVKEHEWLRQFVGEWTLDTEVFLEPGQPPLRCTGTEKVREVGGFWVVGESQSEMPGMPAPMKGVLTLGYDPAKQKYVGTWIDSMGSYLWQHEGAVDATGKILTLETEGPCPKKPGQLSKFKEVAEFKSADHRVFTSMMLGDDGKWTTSVVMHARRKR